MKPAFTANVKPVLAMEVEHYSEQDPLDKNLTV